MSKIFKAFNRSDTAPNPDDSRLQVSVEILKELGYPEDEEGSIIQVFKELFSSTEKRIPIGKILTSDIPFNKRDFINILTDLLVRNEDATARDVFYGVNIFDREHVGSTKESYMGGRKQRYICDKAEHFYTLDTAGGTVVINGLNSSVIQDGSLTDVIVDGEGVRLRKGRGGNVIVTPSANDCIFEIGATTEVVSRGGNDNIYYLCEGFLNAIDVASGLVVAENRNSTITTTGYSPIVVSDSGEADITMNGLNGCVFSYGGHTVVRGKAELEVLLLKGSYSNAALETMPDYFYLGDYCTLTFHDISSNTLRTIRAYGRDADVTPYTWYRVTNKETSEFEKVIVSPLEDKE